MEALDEGAQLSAAATEVGDEPPLTRQGSIGLDILARLASVEDPEAFVVDDVGAGPGRRGGVAVDAESDDAGGSGQLPLGWGHGRSWLPGEDAALLDAVNKYGPRWFVIASELQKLGSRRTAAMCRNRHLRIKAPAQGKMGRNRCKRCGQFKKGHTCAAPELAKLPPREVLDREASVYEARARAAMRGVKGKRKSNVRAWSAVRAGRSAHSDDDDDDDDDDEGPLVNWAMCDTCEKWRRLPPGAQYESDALPEQWFCHMNPDPTRNKCEDPEEGVEMDDAPEPTTSSSAPQNGV